MSSDTLVPLVFWGSRPPTHKICSVLVTPDFDTVITGCRDGHICLWNVQSSNEILPRRILFGHSDSVNALAYVDKFSGSGGDEGRAFLSTANNGEICLWDLNDGKCVEFTMLPGKPVNIISKVLTLNGKSQPCVLCYGNFSEVLIFNAQTLKISLTLVSKIFPDWISSVCVLPQEEKDGLNVVGLTTGGTLKVWKHSATSTHTYINEDESKHLSFTNSLSIVSCKSNKNLLLIVTALSWHICDSVDFSVLCCCPKNSNHHWVSGFFLNDGLVALWTRKGDVLVYCLPFDSEGKELYRSSLNGEPSLYLEPVASFTPLSPAQQILPPSTILLSTDNNTYKVLIGDCTGTISIFDLGQDKFSLKLLKQSSLEKLWKELHYHPAGIIDQLSHNVENPTGICSTLFIAKYCFLCCGREDGTIVVVPASKACKAHLLKDEYSSRKGWPPHRTLRGHRDKVTCLIYPNQESPDRYGSEILVSGGADFSVLIWDIFNGSMLYSFHIHGGEVTQLLIPPNQCNQRVKSSICSVGQDNSVALLNLRDRKCIFLASNHPSPITAIKWRPDDDFLIVACSNLSIFVWQMETGHLDRYEEGNVASSILAACDENVHTDHLTTNFRSNIVNNLKKKGAAAIRTVAEGNMKSFFETKGDSKAEKQGHKQGGEKLYQPMNISAFRTSPHHDFDSHIVFFNTEDLISTLLKEDSKLKSPAKSLKRPESVSTKKQAANTGNPLNRLLQNVKHQFLDDDDETDQSPKHHVSPVKRMKKSQSSHLEVDSAWDISQIVLSCLYAWGLDKSIDMSVKEKLGVLLPKHPLCFGVLSREHCMSLSLPHMQQADVKDFEIDMNPWKVSSSLTTQNLLSIISIANTMMELPMACFKQPRKKALETTDTNSDDFNGIDGIHHAQVKQSWSLLTTLHCVLLPEAIHAAHFCKAPNLELLARKWQDRCLEIREASQALMLAELGQMGAAGRKHVVNIWSQHLPDYMHNHPVGTEGSEQVITSFFLFGNAGTFGSNSTGMSGGEMGNDRTTDQFDNSELIASTSSASHKLSYETRRRHATAIVILGVIGAEFGQELEPSRENSSDGISSGCESGSNASSGGKMHNSLVRHTSRALVYLLLQPPSVRLPLHAPIRRAAIDLIGRGFTVWEPYMEVSAVLLGLLDLCEHYTHHSAAFHTGLPLPPAADSCRSAHHALSLIATARPLTFVTTIAREVARHNAAAANPQHQALLQNSVLARARPEVLRIVEQLADKMLSDLHKVLVEVVDIVLFCVDTSMLRASFGLLEAVPALARFHSVSYDARSRRVASATSTGSLVLHDIRSCKHQTMARGPGRVSALCFSPEGKYLAVYSADENQMSFWLTATSLFGMLQSQVKCIKTVSALKVQARSPGDGDKSASKYSLNSTKMYPPKLVWVNNRIVVLLTPDGNELRFHV